MLKVLLAVQTPRGRDLRRHVAADLLKELLPRASGAGSLGENWKGPQVTTSGLSACRSSELRHGRSQHRGPCPAHLQHPVLTSSCPHP